jgi:hypothetical protein
MAGGSFWIITSRRISGVPFLMISCTSRLRLIWLISCGVRPVYSMKRFFTSRSKRMRTPASSGRSSAWRMALI